MLGFVDYCHHLLRVRPCIAAPCRMRAGPNRPRGGLECVPTEREAPGR
jgi:hypothetical protein